MASTRDIRRRIKSVKNTAQITKAMQMVAAAKMRKAQQAALVGRPYAALLNVMMAETAIRTHHDDAAFLDRTRFHQRMTEANRAGRGLGHHHVQQRRIGTPDEQSARMVAMKNATDNAKQIIKDLTLEYNKLRQANITKELLEITTAQMALG